MQNTGQKLRDAGIMQAITHAEEQHNGWCDMAYNFLYWWLGTIPPGTSFMLEEVRMKAEDINVVPPPPSKRAWGAIILKARKNNLVSRCGYGQVINPSAHRANATIWQKN